MKYRKLGKTELNVSEISLGTEYLINIPSETVKNVIHKSIEKGINYFDLFFAQSQFRDNMGAAFKGYRDKAILAAHLGAADINGQYEKTRDLKISEQFFHDFLKRFKTDYTDILFLHNCDTNDDYKKVMNKNGLLDLAKRFKKEGKTRYIAYSGHNTATSLRAVESGKIDVLMFSVNFTNHTMSDKNKLLEACIANNVGLVAMKVYAGGNLLKKENSMNIEDYQMGRTEMPGAALTLKKSSTITPVQCLSYVLDLPGVSTVLPGCANLKELDDSLEYLNASEKEKDYSKLLSDFMEYKTGQCVHCNHCLPCPSKIDIGQTLRLLQMAKCELTAELQTKYEKMPKKASDCTYCGQCTKRCPFGVDVVLNMKEAVNIFR